MVSGEGQGAEVRRGRPVTITMTARPWPSSCVTPAATCALTATGSSICTGNSRLSLVNVLNTLFSLVNRKTRHHARQVFKEEEEAIKVNLHEGCGRTKLFWLTAAADSATLKGMIEFREDGSKKKASAGGASTNTCKYCGGSSCAAMPVLDGVCSQEECQGYLASACVKTLTCGHPCGGIAAETKCLPCLQVILSSHWSKLINATSSQWSICSLNTGL